MLPDVTGVAAMIAAIKAMDEAMKKKGMLRDPTTGKYCYAAATKPTRILSSWDEAIDDFAKTPVKDRKKVDVEVVTAEVRYPATILHSPISPEFQKHNIEHLAKAVALQLVEQGLLDIKMVPAEDIKMAPAELGSADIIIRARLNVVKQISD